MATLEFVIADLTRFTERVVTALTLDVTARLIETTPIDLGWARANWVPAIGNPFRVEPGARPTEAGGVSRAAQDSGIASVIASYMLRSGPIYISNNVPYIQALNAGHSKQAPAGFVQAAVEQAAAELRRL